MVETARNTDSEVEIWSDDDRSIARSGHGELPKRPTVKWEDVSLQPRLLWIVIRIGVPVVCFVLAVKEQIYAWRPMVTVGHVSPCLRVKLPMYRRVFAAHNEQRVIWVPRRQHLLYARLFVGPHHDVHVVVPGDAVVVPQGPDQRSRVDEVRQVGPLNDL